MSNNKPTYQELEEQLIEREKLHNERLEIFFKLSPSLIVIKNNKGEVVKVNTSFMSILGYTEKEILKIELMSLVHPEDLEKTEKARELEKKNGIGILNFINRYKNKNGIYKTLEWQATIVKSGFTYAFASDVTERAKALKELLSLNKEKEKHAHQLNIANKELVLQNKEKEKRGKELIKTKELLFQNKLKEQGSAALIQNEKRLNEAQATAKVGSWEFDVLTSKLIWSLEHYRIFELEETPPEKLYNAYRNKIHPEDIPELDRLIKNAIATGHGYEYEHRILCKDGGIKYVLGIGKTLANENGKIISINGTLQDITLAKLIQKTLDHKSEKLNELNNALNQAQKLSHIGSWQWNIETDKAEWSDEMYIIYGVNKASFYPSNENVSKLVLPEDTYKVEQGTASLLVDKMFIPFEFRIKRPSGEIRNLYIMSLEKNSKNSIFGVTKDITEQKQQEREKIKTKLRLKNTEKKLNEAQKLAHIGSWLFNARTLKIEWSKETFHIWNFNSKNGAPEYDALVNRVHKDDLEIFNRSVMEALNLGKPFDFEHRICPPDKVQKVIRGIGQPVFDENRKIIGLAGTNQDITSQKLFEEAQIKHQRLKAIGEMSASIAHDFNNALQQMMGNLEVVKIQKELSNNSIDRLNSIGSIIDDISSRVSALQKFGDTENTDNQTKLIDLNTLILESLKESRPLWKDGMEKEGLSITVATEFEEIPKISCNSGELKSVLYNLIKNSIEAMPKGGSLTIHTRLKADGVIATFTDTGVGMNEEEKLKVFQPFFSTKGFKLGRGLGMSGVYSIIKNIGGDIFVTSSEVNKGTTIEIVFPRHT
ncbi:MULTISPECIES: PAS domain-containing sensor histidine kinase [unclassified Polaribacter]|uniref:PAS domain-containing sensor histidine kinase n=1 Tax=unclassified Polaribacter TaxID=196858 RepID=UPI0011BF336B|nr:MULTISPECIES: PAS domain-containing sensor histidine kinase [unclassified Polaribacter]TXD50249.1 PAS domain S-box protein [Polaribacter sp. IC063]TXD56253.1 PAS domain S-box protein [Polaribacter sp. IC066]